MHKRKEESNMYQLIVIDLDGTLLNPYSEVTKENKEAILEAKQKGIEVVLASGRIASSIENIAKEVGADHYYISGNGALVYDMQKQEIVYENYIHKKEMLELIKICEENSIYYNIYTEQSVLAKSLNYNVAFYQYENSKKGQSKKTMINLVDNMYEYVQNSNLDRFLKMTICDSDKIIFSSILRKLKKIPHLDVLDVSHMSRKYIKNGTEKVSIEYYYTEITKKNTNKWEALQSILKRENIEKEQIMAIGDNVNDKEIIENAGLGIAMGHSTPLLKNVADDVTKDNEQNGVASAIRKYIG